MLHHYTTLLPPGFEWWHIPLLFLATLIGESFGALVGGGSIATMPALLFTGIPLQSAIAIDSTFWIGTLSGIISETREKIAANKKLVILLMIPSISGAIVGTWLLLTVSGVVIKYLTAAAVAGVAVHMCFSHEANSTVANKKRYLLALAFLFLIGMYASFLSVGQGSFSRVGLMSILGWSFMQSQGITAAAAVPARIYTLVVTGMAGLIVWPYWLTMACSSFIAGKYATKFAKHIPDKHLRTTLTVISLLFVVYLLFFY